MKIVINEAYGGFAVPTEVREILGCDWYPLDDDAIRVRTSKELIDWVKVNPDSPLSIVDLPDEITDFEIDEYDGWENIIAVLDGKIKHFS